MKTLRASELASRFDCVIQRGNADVEFRGIATLARAGATEVSFLANPKYVDEASRSGAGGIICSPAHAQAVGEAFSGTLFVARDPYAVFARVSQHFFEPRHPFAGVSPQAFIDATAVIPASCTIFPFVFVGPGAVIGEGCVLYPGAFLGAGSTLGTQCVLYPNAVVREGCSLGDRCVLNPGAVVGGDGFGFAPSGRENLKIPQVGGVTLGDDVELGSNASVDRGMSDNTTVGAQTKIDSLVQVGHNVTIGESCFLCGLTGVAGSSKLGNRVTLAGQVGVAGHVSIGDNATIYAQSGVAKDVPPRSIWMGSPARPFREYMRAQATLNRLVETSRQSSTPEHE